MPKEQTKAKVATKVSSFEEVQRSLQEVEKRINDLANSINKVAEDYVRETEGKSGDLKLTKKGNGTYNLEACTEEGWKKFYSSNVSTSDGLSEVYLSDKPRIEKIVATDEKTFAEDSRYELTGLSLLKQPDYDSTWLAWDHTAYNADDNDTPLTVTHNLNAVPILVQIYFAPTTDDQGQTTMGNQSFAGGTTTANLDWFTPITHDLGEGYNHGIASYISTTQVKLHSGDSSSHAGSFDGTSTPRVGYLDGWVRILLWK